MQVAELLATIERSQQAKPVRSAAEGVALARDPASAATGIVKELRADLADGQTYVVWLLDASISLVQDRHNLASALRPFYEDFKPRRGKAPPLMSAVVAFGQNPLTVQDTTAFGEKTLTAIKDMPLDPSGVENVMHAVQAVVARFSVRSKQRLRIVIWTDESGDDVTLLEPTIALCRKTGTVVHVVGPSSVMGTDRGLQPYTHPQTGYRFLRPVRRGPDTCFIERLLLPYWFDSGDAPGMFKGFMVADGVPWYGGPLRERLMSGVGPYALTRLALQTAGSFTLLDRPGEGSRFDLQKMQGLFPDYGSADEIMESVRQSQFRSAVCRAVELTYTVPPLVPRRQFFGVREEHYPFREVGVPYVPPPEFRAQLAGALAEEVRQARAAAAMVENALSSFRDDIDWDYEYGLETSGRWQAWYDLTRGRLLMMSIRLQEYLTACQWLTTAGNLLPATNCVQFAPGPSQLTGRPQTAARRTLAMELLQRCREKNTGTPWESLASWELETDTGVLPVQDHIPPPPPPQVGAIPIIPSAPAPVISLPRM